MSVEEIYISALPSDFTDEQPPAARVSDAVLEQHNRLRFSQCTFDLFNRHYLAITRREPFGHSHSHELNLGILDAEPERSLRIAWGYLLAFVVLCAAAGLIGLSGLIPDSGMLLGITLSSAALCLLLGVYRSRDRLVFYSRHGRLPLIVLLNRRPNRAAFKHFTETLIRHIQDAGTHLDDQGELLRRELREHRRLMEAGAISEESYTVVKQRILSMHQ